MSLDATITQRVLEAAPTIIYVYDVQNGRSVFQNRRFGELLGYASRPDDTPSEWIAFIHPEDRQRFTAHRDRLREIRPGEILFWEFRMRDSQGAWRWFQSRDSLLSSDAHDAPLFVVGSASEISEQKEAEQRKELLAEEMRHRARNLVAIVQAIARMSRPKDQPEVNKYIDVFMGRLLTLLNTGSVVLSSASRTAELDIIARTALSAFGSEGLSPRISITGPSVALPERIAGGLALAFHELATNAVKYGALSVETGAVSLTWALTSIAGGKILNIKWTETGGPPASPPAKEGFGSLVVRQSVVRETGGNVVFDFSATGLSCELECQLPEG